MKVSLKSKGLRSVSDLAKVKGSDARALGDVAELDLSGNKIESLLLQVLEDGGSSGRTSALQALASLERLDLKRNHLGTTQLLGLEAVAHHLTYLNVSDNFLEALSGLEACRGLRYIDVSRNQLKSLRGLPVVSASPFVVKASGNFIASTTGLLQDLRDSVGLYVTEIDLSLNKLLSAPVPLMSTWSASRAASDLVEASRQARIEFPRLSSSNLDCNPFLINGSFESSLDSIIRWLIQEDRVAPADVQRIVQGAEGAADAWLALEKAAGIPTIHFSANGRNASEESSWKERTVSLIAKVARSKGRAVDSRTSTPEEVVHGGEVRSSKGVIDTSVEERGDGLPDVATATTASELQVLGLGRVSGFANGCDQRRRAAPHSVASSSSCSSIDPALQQHHQRHHVSHEFLGGDATAMQQLSVSPRSNRSATLQGRPSVSSGGASSSEQSIDWRETRFLSRENAKLRSALEDQKRIVREQLTTIRALQDDRVKDRTLIRELQDRLKRKNVESACALKRAHEAEALAVGLKEKENVLSERSHLDPVTGFRWLSNNMDGGGGGERSFNRSATLMSFSQREQPDEPLYERRTFHLDARARAKLMDEHNLSRRLSCSYDKCGKLIPGRYPHAHRSYTYSDDLPSLEEERVRYDRLAQKHRIECDVATRPRVSTHGNRCILGGGDSAHAAHGRPRTAADGGADGAVSDNNVREGHLDPRDEAILFLSERVAQLEAMVSEQATYCADLSQENDELLHKYEATLTQASVSRMLSRSGLPTAGDSSSFLEH